jgi:hypothetical protein
VQVKHVVLVVPVWDWILPAVLLPPHMLPFCGAEANAFRQDNQASRESLKSVSNIIVTGKQSKVSVMMVLVLDLKVGGEKNGAGDDEVLRECRLSCEIRIMNESYDSYKRVI